MNLAFVVGVSRYSNIDDLPACRADAELLRKILRATNRYNQVVYYIDNTRSNHIKANMADFVRHHHRANIDEFFWYFSGHGQFSDGDFRYLLSDYDEERPMQTTLSNSDVDGFIRSLRPKLAVKVVDACNAGTSYVKDSNALRKHLNESRREFRNCYFMFSSLQSQSSYQNSELSFFTKSFCRSIAVTSAKEIRYKDIIDFVSDEFEGSQQQTPLFVNQANFTEKFASNVADLKLILPTELRSPSERRQAVQTPSQRPSVIKFSPDEVGALFGQEDAQMETPQRLREYYFKSEIFEYVTMDSPLKILVGHKGIGKSALFRVAVAENRDAFRFCVLIKPDDIVELSMNHTDFLKHIRSWKVGLVQLIVNRVIRQAGLEPELSTIDSNDFEMLRYLRQRFTESGTDDAWGNRAIQNFMNDPAIDVYIDDVERGWQGQLAHINRISALFNAVRDISAESHGVHFKISLRSDVYYLVRTSDESTDKIEGSVVWYSWSNQEIFELLIKRILTFFGKPADESRLAIASQSELASYLSLIMEERFAGEGRWADTPMRYVLLSLIRKRPRDLVKLCTLAGTQARKDKSNLIRTSHLVKSFEEYSQGRLLDTVNEFRSELPDIERLLMNMRPSKKERTAKEAYVYSTERLLQKIDDLRGTGPFRFATGLTATPRELAAFLYKINFITGRRETDNGIVRKYFEENRYLQSKFVDFGFDWEIHPAYRWALQPESLGDIYKNVDLSAD